jgi:polar amino acid transport system permease protein
MPYDWNFSIVVQYLPKILQGGLHTLALSGAAIALAAPIGILMGILRQRRVPFLAPLAVVYIDFFRTSVALVLICWCYYALPMLIGVKLDTFTAVLIAIALQSSAYMAELVRAGLQSIAIGQLHNPAAGGAAHDPAVLPAHDRNREDDHPGRCRHLSRDRLRGVSCRHGSLSADRDLHLRRHHLLRLPLCDRAHRALSGTAVRRGRTVAPMAYTWDFGFLLHLGPLLWAGLLNTAKLWAVALSCGLAIGLVFGILRSSPSAPLRGIGTVYVEAVRNTPGLVQLIWVFYALPILTGMQSSAWVAASVSLSLYTGAYSAEIYRAGIASVELGQWEAARALGFRYRHQMSYVVLPQALMRMVPAFGNRAIELAKATTLASTIAFGELLYTAKTIAEDQLRPLETYTAVTVIFTVVLLPVSYLCIRLERRLARSSSLHRD